jgi:hypothetical protein
MKKTAAEIDALVNARVIEELDKIDTDELYDQMLDDCFSLESVGGPFAHMSASRVLKEVDPVAYRCGKNDWEDSESREQWEEIEGDYYDKREVEEIREEIESENDDDENEKE